MTFGSFPDEDILDVTVLIKILDNHKATITHVGTINIAHNVIGCSLKVNSVVSKMK